MKRIAISILLCIIGTTVNATTPYPPKVFVNDSWTFVAGFAWPDENDKVLIIRTVEKTSLLSLEELAIPIKTWSTAGSEWYQNSIGFVTSVKIKGAHSEPDRHVFYFRNRNGKESVVDLNTTKLIGPATILNRVELNRKTISHATSLLRSSRPHDRQTAATHLGHLGTPKHLSQLTKLLSDKAAYTQISGDQERTVYYVKEAAEKAIKLINSKNATNKTNGE